MSNHDDTVVSSSVKNETKFRPGWRRPQQPREAGGGCNKGRRDNGVRRGAGLEKHVGNRRKDLGVIWLMEELDQNQLLLW